MIKQKLQILVIAPAWIGDMVMSQSLLIALKEKYPDSIIDIIAPKSTATIAQKFPQVNKIFTLNIAHKEFAWKKRATLAKQLKGKYDIAYILPNSWKSALIPFLAKIPIRIGWLGEARYLLINKHRGKRDKKALPLMIQGYLGLVLDSEQIKFKPVNQENLLSSNLSKYFPIIDIKPLKEELAKKLNFSYICLCPGAAYGPAKRWPHFYFAELAKLIIETFHNQYQILILGGPDELEISNYIETQVNSSQLINLVTKTSLLESIDILAQSKLNVANDSGLMHLSNAVNSKTIALYGPTSPGYAPPLNNKAQIIYLGYPTDPKVRVSNDHPDGYHRSMLDIFPLHVFNSLKSLLSN